MTLETERLILRPFDESDAESVFEYAKDPDVGPIAGWPPHTSVENSREIIQTVLAVPETYAICLKPDNTAIGAVGLMIENSNLELKENEGEIGFWLGKPFWGQGIMPEAVNELIRHAFKDLKLETLWCGYFDGNYKSKRVQEKCGFIYHHTDKDIHWKLMDDIRTEHITRLTKEDWKKALGKNTLETDRLIIYPASQKQMEAFISEQFVDVLKEAYTEMLDGCLSHPEQWEWYAIWMIELKDGTHVGELCFKGLSREGITEIGYGIADEYQGRGYATEAVRAVTDWALGQPCVMCVTAETEESNIPSQKVMTKAGFKPTGESGEEGPIYARKKDR